MNLLDKNKTNAVRFGDNNLGQLPENISNNNFHSHFDYTDIEDDDKVSLMRFESAITQKTREVAASLVEIGKYLSEAEIVFRKYNAENSDKEPLRYQEWYENLGYNAKSVSVSKRAYEICSKYGTVVEDFSGKMIEAITSKDMKANPELQEEIIEKIKTGEIKTVKDVKEYKDKTLDIMPPKKEKSKDSTLPEVNCSDIVQGSFVEENTCDNSSVFHTTENDIINYIDKVRYSDTSSSQILAKVRSMLGIVEK